ncbi:Hypothetical protein FKW44_002124 [Caligus rogercresseyi]|uniref:Uncharacterized protein n=1 Tax=Caligus rogercresseyi TaxID=217165 RepID=A0A7T8KJR4_CALRO|nr:Hypothetical protein FKW44_002124 [Caligus rogercresseyi]
MYFNKFPHILLGLHYSFEPPHGGGNTAGISSSDKDFTVQATHNSQKTGFI